MKTVDLTGSRFGRLTVIHKARSRRLKNGCKVYWLCRCDCGTEKEVMGCNLKAKEGTRSCGCLVKEFIINRQKVEYGLSAKRDIYYSYKVSAKRRGRDFKLSFEQFLELSSKTCHYCGVEPSNLHCSRSNNGDFMFQGIDRIDNKKGYYLENLVPCCWNCNQAKRSLTYDEFITWIKRLTDYQNSKDKLYHGENYEAKTEQIYPVCN